MSIKFDIKINCIIINSIKSKKNPLQKKSDFEKTADPPRRFGFCKMHKPVGKT